MKTLYLLGACALLSTTLFSCTADEFETATTAGGTEQKSNYKPIDQPIQAVEGPEDDPITVPPPPPKK